jgi:hypothetical protein
MPFNKPLSLAVILVALFATLPLWSACADATDVPSDGDAVVDGDQSENDPDGEPDGDIVDGDQEQARCADSMHWDDDLGMCLPGRECPNGMSWNAELSMCIPTPDGDLDDDQDEEIEADAEPYDPPDTFSCESLGLPVRLFESAESSKSLYALAADITLPTRKGDWRLSEHYSGCESYLFIQDIPKQTAGWSPTLFSRDLDALLARLPRNTHVFFVSTFDTEDRRAESLALLDTQLAELVPQMSEADRAHWYHHLHVVTAPTTELPDWLGQLFTSPRWGVGIDRFQRIRYIGSYADPSRYSADKQWFGPNLEMAANEAIYYNFEAERQQALDAQNATVLTVFDNELLSDPGWAGEWGYAEVAFPDAATMAGFDTMELDLYLGCQGNGEYGDCPAWDYIVHLNLCDADNSESCGVELGRWITTYHREGRWVHDVSPLLPLVAQGGVRRLAFYTQQPYETTLRIRLSDSGGALRPISATPLFTGGGFNTAYNDKYSPVEVAIPADAAAVKLATVITGHGMSSPGNCAEFCNTTHHFAVNDSETVVSFPLAGNDHGCMDQAAQGTVPNQYGTWWYGRSGWCPGKEVQMETHDVTEAVTPGETASISYAGYYRDAPYSGDGANIVLTSWLVVYEAKAE